MRALITTCVLLVGLTGCASVGPPSGAILHGVLDNANLALGPTAEHNIIGEYFAGRSAWPAVEHGYYTDQYTVFYDVQYNDETFWEHGQGGFSRETESIRTGVYRR